MRVLFWGTPDFAVPALKALLRSSHAVVGLVTQPDRARRRSRRPQPPPTKRHLLQAGQPLPIFQPVKPFGTEFCEQLAALEPDVSVVAGYGNLLPGRLLSLPPLGSLNIHASLLPRHRGASPVAAAILAGDAVSGITLMRMDRGLDTGPILLQRPLSIGNEESCGELTGRLARLGAEVVLEGLALADQGRLTEQAQSEAEATYAPRIAPEDARVRWTEPAAAIERELRAYDPWPGAFTFLEELRLKLFRARVWPQERASAGAVETVAAQGEAAPAQVVGRAAALREAQPGQVVAGPPGQAVAGPEPGLFVATGEGLLEVLELQLEGRPRMSAEAFLRGRRIEPGTRLG